MTTLRYPHIFGKAFHELNESDLLKLKEDRVAEGLFIEYKRDWPNPRKIASSICSFANAHGGYLAIGVLADKQHNVPIDIPGIDLEEGLNERIKNVVINSVRPVPLFESRAVELQSLPGKAVLLVRIDESADPPHLLTQSGVIYVRNPTGSDPVPADDRHTINELYLKGNRLRDLVQAQIDARDLTRSAYPRPGKVHTQVVVCPTILGTDLITNLFTRETETTILLKDMEPLHLGGLSIMSQDTLGIGEEDKWFLGISPNGLINYWYADRAYNNKDNSVYLSVVADTYTKVLKYARAKYSQLGYYGATRVLLLLSGIAGKCLEIDLRPGRDLKGSAKPNACYVNRTLLLSDPEFDIEKTTLNVSNEIRRCFGVPTYVRLAKTTLTCNRQGILDAFW